MHVFDECEYIFSDFDGTISKHDVIHSFISNFAIGDASVAEEKWAKGEISTQECMKVQLGLISNLKREEFLEFLNSIEIDTTFIDFLELIKSQNKKIVILSDGFDIFIKAAFKKYGIFDIPIWANFLEIKEDGGFLKFENKHPNKNPDCLIGSGTCKCGVARKYAKNYTYIGDGLSDRCIAKKSALLFAKGGLERFCKKENIAYFPYITFQDIIKQIKKENSNAANDVRINYGTRDTGA